MKVEYVRGAELFIDGKSIGEVSDLELVPTPERGPNAAPFLEPYYSYNACGTFTVPASARDAWFRRPPQRGQRGMKVRGKARRVRRMAPCLSVDGRAAGRVTSLVANGETTRFRVSRYVKREHVGASMVFRGVL